MAISKNGLILLVTLTFLKTGNVIQFSKEPLLEHEEKQILPQARERKKGQWNYIIDVMVNSSDVNIFELIQSSLNTTSFPVPVENGDEISGISITTVCSPTGTGFQCRCEEDFAWPYSTCVTYGACDYLPNGICKCINAIPSDAQTCEPITAVLAQFEYEVDVELNLTDVEAVDYVRRLLRNGSFYLALDRSVNVAHINVTTVCYLSDTNFQCRCEDQYVWSYENCFTYGVCDEVTNDTCSCINNTPSSGQYCQPKTATRVTSQNTTVATTVSAPMKATSTTANSTYPTTDSTPVSTMTTNSTNNIIPIKTTTFASTIDLTMAISPISTMTADTSNITIPTMTITKANTSNTTMTTTKTNTTITSATSTTTPTAMTTTATLTMNTTTANTTIPTMTTTATSTFTTAMAATTPISTTMPNITVPTTTFTTTTTTAPTTKKAMTTIPTNITTTVTTAPTVPSTTATPTITTTTAAITIPTTTESTTNVMTITSSPSTTMATNAPSTYSTTSTITVTPTPSRGIAVFGVEMSVILQEEYTSELSNATSQAYKELKSKIDPVLTEQYKGITGFVHVFVKQFRKGSIITDFVVQTTQVNSDEIAEANQKLPQAMKPIAHVIGSVSSFYTSPISITIPNITYTGNRMTLTCGPPPENIDVGQIYGSEWKYEERNIRNGGRIEIITVGNVSMLTVNNTILADTGLYKCTLRGSAMDFLQAGNVTEAQIKQAPNVQLQSEVNVRCTNRQMDRPLNCCVQHPYTVRWFQGMTALNATSTNDTESYCITYNHRPQNCSGSKEEKIHFICRVDNPQGYEMTTTMTIFIDGVQCNDAQYGTGRTGDRSVIWCDKGQEGSKTAVCQSRGWECERDTCVVTKIKELLIESQDLVADDVSKFVVNLNEAVLQDKTQITNLSATMSVVVNILSNIANISTVVNETAMQNVLNTVDAITGEDARDSWAVLNANKTSNVSSELLGSLETISNKLDGEFTIKTPWILVNRTIFNNSFRADLNSSVIIDIPNTNVNNVFITTITFYNFYNAIPTRNSTSLFSATSNGTGTDNVINAAVVLIKINATIQSITLSYKKLDSSLTLNPQCVFWNFTLFDHLGAWDNEGCTFVSDINNTVTCNCNHLTSFSILMATDVPESIRVALDIITYIGVGISLASLVICLIVEGYVWKAITKHSTAFMRHVSIVNIALSLLIADICFIIGASVAKNPSENPGEDYNVPVGPCSAATFFMHFFYLALFFWMLVSGLLLFYRTMMVFSHMSKSVMLAISFILGYGCPLIIAVITVAVTAPINKYYREHYSCWLNWTEKKTLLALVIPALTIIFINFFIIIAVLYKMLKRSVGDAIQKDEKHTLVVIARCVIVLTPLFGLTWALGVGTMISSSNKGIHIVFALLNSLQGFLILVLGTLYDSKVRLIISKIPSTPSTGSSNDKCN